MKLPRFSLRTMLIAVAMIAAAVGWLSYEWRRQWTVERIERLIKDEYNPSWVWPQFEAWVKSHGIRPVRHGRDEYEDRKIWISQRQGATFPWFSGRGSIWVSFNRDQNGRYPTYTIDLVQED
jgi:hypothetical protein